MVKKQSIPGEIHVDIPGRPEQLRLHELTPYVRQTDSSLRTNWHIGGRKLLDYLLVFVASGTATFTIEGETIDVKKNDFIWIPPNTLHDMRGSEKTLCNYIHFDLIYAPERSHWKAYIPGGTTDLSKHTSIMHPPVNDPLLSKWKGKLIVNDFYTVAELVNRIITLHRQQPSGAELMLSGLMLQLLSLLLEEDATKQHPYNHYAKAIQRCADFIIENYNTAIDFPRLAKKSGLSPSHFRKVFRTLQKQSALELQQKIKLQRACELLAYTQLNISEIAEKTGFNCIYSFSRFFKEKLSISPRQYRKTGRPAISKID